VSEMIRKGVVLVALLTMLAVGLAFGEDYDPCYEAYLESGLTQQQMSFDQFRHSYTNTLCAKGREASGVTHEAQAL
jgi:hypothetical protein